MDLEATDAERKQLAYSTQLFDFTPDAFVDSITAPSLDYINNHLDAAKERCAQEFVGKTSEKELEVSFVLIKDAYSSHASEVFDKLGRYLKKNIINVPKNVVLPEDRPHLDPEAKNYKKENLEGDLKQFDDLRQEVVNTRYRKTVLEAKLANLEVVAQRQEILLKHAELFDAERSTLNSLFDQQHETLKKKLATLNPILDEIYNNIPGDGSPVANGVKHKQVELEELTGTKKFRLDKENQETE
jgi:hypothetical protein